MVPHPSPAPEPRLLTPAFALLVGGHFLQALGYASMILLPLYLDWLGASRAEVGAMMALGPVGGLATRPLVGWALDHWGRKRTLLLGTAVLASGVGMIGLVTALGAPLAVSRLLTGVGQGVLFTGYYTMVADVLPEARRTEGLALFGISGLVPLAMNPLAGRVGIEAPDLRWFFVGVAVLIALSALFVMSLPRANGTQPPPVRLREALVALRARRLWPVWWATLIFGGLVYVFMSYVTVAAEARGLEEPALLWLFYAVGAIGVRVVGARLPDRLGPSLVLPPALLFYSAAFVLAGVSSGAVGFGLAGLLAGLGHGYSFPILAGQTFTRSPPGLRGSAMAAFTALWDLAAIVLVPLAGILADAVGDRAMLLDVAAIAVSALALWGVLEWRLGRAADPAREAA